MPRLFILLVVSTEPEICWQYSRQDRCSRNCKTMLNINRAGLVISFLLLFPLMQLSAQENQTLPAEPAVAASAGQQVQAEPQAIPAETPEITEPLFPDTLIEQADNTLPHNLTPWGMYQQADWVVKTVMIGLLLASLLSWTVFVAKWLELRKAEQSQRQLLKRLATARGIAELTKDANAPEMVLAAATELKLSSDALHDPDGIKERLTSQLDRLEAATGRAINHGTGILATIGSTAPFIGLFGTVWGIMNSFIGISKAQTTNLAVVAPGIAEALLATAIGLVAAISAVIIYNYFARRISGYKALVSDTSAAILRLVSRDLSRGQVQAANALTENATTAVANSGSADSKPQE